MQRLTIDWLPNLIRPLGEPLTDEAGYFEIAIETYDEERVLRAVGFGSDGEAFSEHVVPLSLVRSVSARPIKEIAE